MRNSRFNDPEQLSRKIRQVDREGVDGNLFLDVLLSGLRLANAAELARKLPVAPAVLSRIRSGATVSDEMLIKLNLAFGLPIRGLKDLLCACARSDVPVTMARIDALSSAAVFTERMHHEQARLAA